MQLRQDPIKRNAQYSFGSMSEFGDYIENAPRTWSINSSKSQSMSASWDLNTPYEKAVKLAQDGWLEGANKVQNALKAFQPATAAPDTQTDFYGFRPHVPRFCAGAPDSMIRHTDKPDMGCGKVLTLVVPVNALGGVGAQSMSNFGVAVAQYVNQLETDGTRVELIACMVSMVSGWRLAHSWTVKGADQPLDLAVIAFAIGHPAMFRRLGFAARERSCAPMDHSYGHTTPARVSDIVNAPPGTIILNGMANADTYAPTPEKALEYITLMIEKTIEAQHNEQL